MALHKTRALVILIALFAGVAAPMAQAGEGESIWSALVLATNAEQPAEPSPDIANYVAQLKGVFGYNQYELLGQHLESMDSSKEHWLVPSKDFFLRAESTKSEKAGYYRVKLDLYEEKKLLAQMEAKLCGENLLFIRGPQYGNGQLIIVLMLK